MRIPFGGNSINYDKTWLHGNTDYECVSKLTTPNSVYNDDVVTMSDLMKTLKYSEDCFINGTVNFEKPACSNCPNNAKNGGSGICHCTLGQMDIT
jgi:hypothetical protein